MIKRKHINYYRSEIRTNKVKYTMDAGPYRTANDVKVPFSIPEFSRRKIITHNFHVDNSRGDEVIGFDVII